MKVPVLRGQLRGAWWHPASGGKLFRILFGTYEPEQTAAFVRHLKRGDVLFDAGAHTGYYTLLGSRLVGETGRVVAFEPAPSNAEWLRRHVGINDALNVRVVEAAVSDREETARFGGGSGTGTGRLTADGSVEVSTVSIDRFCQREGVRPTALKLDVEGAEAAALAGAIDTLREARPVLFLSTHGQDVKGRCVTLLEGLGYALQPVSGDEVETSAELLGVPDP